MQRTSTKPIPNSPALAEYLRAARPHLIFRVNLLSDGSADGTPCIADVEHRGIEVIDEGYDPYHSPLGCPVYWRVVKRGDGQFYYSTFQVPPDYVLKVWGASGLSYCDPFTGKAVARIETRFPDENVKTWLT